MSAPAGRRAVTHGPNRLAAAIERALSARTADLAWLSIAEGFALASEEELTILLDSRFLSYCRPILYEVLDNLDESSSSARADFLDGLPAPYDYLLS